MSLKLKSFIVKSVETGWRLWGFKVQLFGYDLILVEACWLGAEAKCSCQKGLG